MSAARQREFPNVLATRVLFHKNKKQWLDSVLGFRWLLRNAPSFEHFAMICREPEFGVAFPTKKLWSRLRRGYRFYFDNLGPTFVPRFWLVEVFTRNNRKVFE